MTQYITLNVKLFNSQLNELESGIKVSTEVTSNFSSSMVGDSHDETNIPHKLLLTDTQVSEADQSTSCSSNDEVEFFEENRYFL